MSNTRTPQLQHALKLQRGAKRASNQAKREIITRIKTLVKPYLFQSHFGFKVALFVERNGFRSRTLPDQQLNLYEGITESGSSIDDVWVGMACTDLIDHPIKNLLKIERDLKKRNAWRRYHREIEKIPSGNIPWEDVLPTSRVQLYKGCYVVDANAVAFWSGSDARKAQKYLDGLVEITKSERVSPE